MSEAPLLEKEKQMVSGVRKEHMNHLPFSTQAKLAWRSGVDRELGYPGPNLYSGPTHMLFI